MSEFFQTFLNLEVMAESAGLLARGLLVTVEACLIVIPGGLFFGVGLALAQTLAPRSVTGLLSWGVDLVRAFPPLVLLVLIVHGLPFLGSNRRRSSGSGSRSPSTPRPTTARSCGGHPEHRADPVGRRRAPPGSGPRRPSGT